MVVVVVTRNPALAMALSAANPEVVEVAPTRLGQWAVGEGDRDAEVLVLDLGSISDAVGTVTQLRGQGRSQPIVLVGSSPATRELMAMTGVTLLGPPMDRNRLVAALSAATARLPAGEPEPLGEAPSRASVLDDPGTQLLDVPEPPLLAEPEPPERVIDVRDPAIARPSPGLTELPHHSAPAVATHRAEAQHDQLAASLTTQSSVDTLVHALLRANDALFGVVETAEVVVADARARVACDAAVLLVPDGLVWRISAHSGVPAPNPALSLTREDALVRRMSGEADAVALGASDVVRQSLLEAPLGALEHLVAAEIREVHAVLLVGRGADPGFTEEDLASLLALAQEASSPLVEAVRLRALARSLARHCDRV